jgi:hypothetical protein
LAESEIERRGGALDRSLQKRRLRRDTVGALLPMEPTHRVSSGVSFHPSVFRIPAFERRQTEPPGLLGKDDQPAVGEDPNR